MPRSSGAVGRKSRYVRMTALASVASQKIGPAYTMLTGCAWNRKLVTTPKLPPPPRSAQNRSGCCVSLAVTTLPSASTTSASSRLSIVRPCLRVEVPGAAAERESGDAGGRDDAEGNRQAEGVRGVIDVARRAAGIDAHGAVRGIHAHALHHRQVDDQAVVAAAEARAVVAAAADREQQALRRARS